MTDGDTAWHPTATAEQLSARARLLHRIRTYFHERRVLEVETPILSGAGNSDPGIEQFRSTDGRWLRTSPEYAMKRLIAAGSGDIFELGRVFRAGEAGAWHNPEFTLLEWYRVGWSHTRLMDEVADLVADCGAAFGHRWTVRRLAYRDWVHDVTGIDPIEASRSELRRAVDRSGVSMSGLDELGRDALLDLVVSHLVQPTMDSGTLTLVDRYPASQAALARLCGDDPRVSERFEAFLGSVELANGYGELTDAVEQRRRFEVENQHRIANGATPVPLDERLLAALESGMPDCAGVALGVDRLQMVLTDAATIRDVVAFTADRS